MTLESCAWESHELPHAPSIAMDGPTQFVSRIGRPEAPDLRNMIMVYFRERSPTHAAYSYKVSGTVISEHHRLAEIMLERAVSSLKQHSSFAEAANRKSWLALAYSTTADFAIKEIATLIQSISKDLRDSAFSAVDHALENADLSKMSLDAVVAISRTTFSARAKLAHWANFVDRARKELEARGEKGPYLPGL